MNRNNKKTVLIIDNDSIVRQTLVEMVAAMGHQTLALDRASGAASILLGRSVNAILLDLHMPGPHGQDLLRFLKKKGISVPPTIVVSGYLQHEAINDLLKLGVAGIIAKPFDPKRLQDELGRVLDGRDGQVHFCPQCGATMRQADRFCRQCGTTLEARICPRCQTPYNPGDRFCGECGEQLAQ